MSNGLTPWRYRRVARATLNRGWFITVRIGGEAEIDNEERVARRAR